MSEIFARMTPSLRIPADMKERITQLDKDVKFIQAQPVDPNYLERVQSWHSKMHGLFTVQASNVIKWDLYNAAEQDKVLRDMVDFRREVRKLGAARELLVEVQKELKQAYEHFEATAPNDLDRAELVLEQADKRLATPVQSSLGASASAHRARATTPRVLRNMA